MASGQGVSVGGLISIWANAVRASTDWRRFSIAVFSGALSVLSLAPFFLWPVLFITLPHLVWLIDSVDKKLPARSRAVSAAWIGWLFGFGYFSAGLFWVGEAFLVAADDFLWALPFAVTLLPAGLALFFAAAVGAARFLWFPGIARILVVAVMLTVAEWLRGHVLTGFPWNTLGYAYTAPLPLAQIVSVIGVYGLTLWVVALSALPAVMTVDANERGDGPWRQSIGALVTALFLVGLWGYGSLRLSAYPLSYVDDVKMRIVQVSVPQREKWIPANQERIFADHLKLSGVNASGTSDNLEGITHVIWPEVALPFLPLEIPVVGERIAAMLPEGTHLLTGALRRDPRAQTSAEQKDHAPPARPTPRRAYNSMLVFDDAGRPVKIYDKIHLVPFGEYLPFQQTLESIGLRQISRMRGGFTTGIEPRPLLNIGKMQEIAGLICYEAIFPGEVSAGPRPNYRPRLYINITNDGWFGNTTGPRQHFQQALVRAVETGVPLLRAANNGISAMIGPAGRVMHYLALNHRGTLDTTVPNVLPATLYSRLGDWIVFAQLVLVFLVVGMLYHRQRALFVSAPTP